MAVGDGAARRRESFAIKDLHSPTRQRHDTLKYAMETVLAQEFDDFELVVMDNFGNPETAKVVDSFGSAKVVYRRSDEVLAMSDNRERGLAACAGEYVTVIGDDDGDVLAARQ